MMFHFDQFEITVGRGQPPLLAGQQTKMPDWTIRGVVRPTQGKPTKTEQAFKTMMGIGKD
jgi:hypothetical protein